MIELEEHSDGIIIPIHARARARQNAIVGEHAGRLKVAVTQAPEKGKANDSILKVIALGLGLRRSRLSLIAGPSSQNKKVLVQGVELDEIRNRINACL